MAVEIVDATNDDTPPEEGVETEEDNTLEVHGDVETVEEGDDVTVEEGDTEVTVVTNDGDAVEGALVEHAIESAVETATLTQRVDALEGLALRVEIIEMQLAARVEETAEAVQEIEEDIEEEEEEDSEEEEEEDTDDREPRSAGVHPIYRPWRDFFRKDS